MKTWLKILLGIAVLGIIGAVLIYVFVYNKPHPDYEKIKPDFTLSAQTLYDAFKGNKASAERLYTGKVIEITGALGKTEITDTTAIAVFVFDQGMFGDAGIRCSFLKKFHDDVKNLVPKTAIRIKGYCTGYTDTDVILEQCSLPIKQQ
jgi:hypothetical protein